MGPAGATGNNFSSFNGATGKIIKDSGKSAASFDTAGAAATAQAAAIAAAAADATTKANAALTAAETFTVARDLGLYNVKDYGAVGDGSNDDYTAIAAAIAAGVATAKGFCLYFPPGIYKSSHALPIALGTGQGLSIVGKGIAVSQVYFSNAGTDNGFSVTRGASAGTYVSDAMVTVLDLGLISAATTGSVGLALTQTAGTTDAGSQGTHICRVGFYRTNNGGTYWDTNLALTNWSNVTVTECFFGSGSACISILGSNGSTSGFYIANNRFQGGVYGVKADGRARGGVTGPDARIEGVQCVNNSFVLTTFAVWHNNDNTGGVCVVQGGQMDPTAGGGAGVYARNVRGVAVSGISIANDGAAAWTGVYLEGDCLGSTVFGNYIAGNNGGGTVTGVYVGSSAQVAVVGNTFTGFTGSNVVFFDTGVSKSICGQNTSDGGTYTDSGTADNFNNNI